MKEDSHNVGGMTTQEEKGRRRAKEDGVRDKRCTRQEEEVYAGGIYQFRKKQDNTGRL